MASRVLGALVGLLIGDVWEMTDTPMLFQSASVVLLKTGMRPFLIPGMVRIV